MNRTDEPISAILTRIQEACRKSDAALIRGFAIDESKLPRIVLEEQEFLTAIAAEKPAAVFYSTLVFDLDQLILSECDDRGLEVDIESEPEDQAHADVRFAEAKAALGLDPDQLRAAQGADYYLHVIYTGNGPMRIASFQTSWSLKVEECLNNILAEAKDDKRDGRLRRLNEALEKNQKVLEPLAREIARHPQFLATKGVAKRISLVWDIFGSRIPRYPETGRVSRAIEHVPGADYNLETIVRMAQHFETAASRVEPAG